MPTYEYICDICNESIALTRSIHEEENIPFHCGQFVRRVYTGLPIRFNSSGFYSTGGQGNKLVDLVLGSTNAKNPLEIYLVGLLFAGGKVYQHTREGKDKEPSSAIIQYQGVLIVRHAIE